MSVVLHSNIPDLKDKLAVTWYRIIRYRRSPINVILLFQLFYPRPTTINWAIWSRFRAEIRRKKILFLKKGLKLLLNTWKHVSSPFQDVFLMIRRHKTTIFTDAKESTTVYELKRIVEGILKRTPEDQRLYKVSLALSIFNT